MSDADAKAIALQQVDDEHWTSGEHETITAAISMAYDKGRANGIEAAAKACEAYAAKHERSVNSYAQELCRTADNCAELIRALLDVARLR